MTFWNGGRWFENNAENRSIARDEDVNGYYISTVFLGINHNFRGNSKPILYETMVFRADNRNGVYQDRYCTKEEALVGHAKAFEMAKNGIIEMLSILESVENDTNNPESQLTTEQSLLE